MSKRSKYVASLVLAIALVFGLSSCSTLPENLDKAANGLIGQIDNGKKANNKAKDEFEKLLKQQNYAFIAAYTPAQQHADRFDQASAKLKEAKKVHDKEVKPLVDNYKDNKKSQLEGAIAKVKGIIAEAKALTADPAAWLPKVAAVKADPNGTVRKAATSVSGLTATYNPLNRDVENAKKTYDQSKTAIDAKFKPLATQHNEALTANGMLQAEAAKASPNYALMTEYAVTVDANTTKFKADSSVFGSQLTRLGVRETHTLLDIVVETEVEISRTTWDESQDFPDEHDYDYPSVIVDQETAEYFSKFSENDVLASDSTGWGSGFKYAKVEKAQWTKLNINARSPKWHSDDDSAEFYLGSLEDTYCHKLQVLKNGKPDASSRPNPTDNYCSKYDKPEDLAQGIYWIEADELNAEAIGMDTYGKDFGYFDDQAILAATPPGMLYVGDSTSGEWKEDGNGNSFWAFYGQYMFFSNLIGGPNPYHYRSEYDDWSRNYRHSNKAYYGTMNGQPRYGLKSPMMQTRFPQSHFVTSGTSKMSVRGAGPAARAGGPGGGGK